MQECEEKIENEKVENIKMDSYGTNVPQNDTLLSHTEEFSPFCHTEEFSPSCHTEERSDVSIHKTGTQPQNSEMCQPSMDSYGTDVPQNDGGEEWTQNDSIEGLTQNENVGEWAQDDWIEEKPKRVIPNSHSTPCHSEGDLSPVRIHNNKCHIFTLCAILFFTIATFIFSASVQAQGLQFVYIFNDVQVAQQTPKPPVVKCELTNEICKEKDSQNPNVIYDDKGCHCGCEIRETCDKNEAEESINKCPRYLYETCPDKNHICKLGVCICDYEQGYIADPTDETKCVCERELCGTECCNETEQCQNGYCVGYCSRFDKNDDGNVCRTCNTENGMISNKPNGTPCSVSFTEKEGECYNGSCRVPCDTQTDCGGSPSIYYCYHVFNYPYATTSSCLKRTDATESYCVSRNQHTYPTIQLNSLNNFHLSSVLMNNYSGDNYCAAWGMKLASYKDFGGYWRFRGYLNHPALVELGEKYGQRWVWVADRPSHASNGCGVGYTYQGLIMLKSGYMEVGPLGSSDATILCITDDSLTVDETDACYGFIESDCGWCDRTTAENKIVYAENGTVCSLYQDNGGICQDGLCQMVGDVCNTNEDCQDGFYCFYQQFDEAQQPTVGISGYKGVCRISTKKTPDKELETSTYGEYASIETSEHMMDYYSAVNFCQSIGKTPISASNCSERRLNRYPFWLAFYEKFKLRGFWAGKGCVVSNISYIAPQSPTMHIYPYCM